MSYVDQETGGFTGYYGDVITDVARKLNFSIVLKVRKSSTTNYGRLLVRQTFQRALFTDPRLKDHGLQGTKTSKNPLFADPFQ